MESPFGFLAACLIGLTGGVHCFGMCGGIVGALALGLPPGREERSLLARLPYLLAYNGGRIASYVVAGALAGAVFALTLYRSKSLSGPIAAHVAANGLIAGYALAFERWELL